MATAKVAANGVYSIVGLSPGAYRSRQTAPSPYVSQWFNNVCVGCPGTPTAVVVAAGATVSNINFSMSAGRRDRWQCHMREPARLTSMRSAQLRVRFIGPPGAGHTALAFGTCSTYTVARLPAGQYYVLARDTPVNPVWHQTVRGSVHRQAVWRCRVHGGRLRRPPRYCPSPSQPARRRKTSTST